MFLEPRVDGHQTDNDTWALSRSRLISLANQASRVVLHNGTTPPRNPCPEAHASNMDYFVDQLQIVLPVLGIGKADSTVKSYETHLAQRPCR